MKSKLVQIYWLCGHYTASCFVLECDLPRLSGGFTYWRESIPDAIRGVLLKKKCALEMAKLAKTSKKPVNIE